MGATDVSWVTFCRERLASFKIPARVIIVEDEQFSARVKKMRRAEPV
jgi:acyl-CoA synthetase (AMP-forming)/AMP-acid ligase II